MDGGYTLWRDEKTRLKGYVVGGVCTESDCLAEAKTRFAELFSLYLHKMDIRDEDKKLGVGTWIEDVYQDRIEGSTCRVYFDIVQHVENEQDAVAMCIERGEKAYFDILNQKSIYITDEK
jgi:hypothetical protein